MPASFRVGMIGCGTVGTGVLELLHRRRQHLEELLGRSVEVTRIAVRDPDRPRRHAYGFVSPEAFTGDLGSVTRADDIDLVVEVAGGVDGPRDWMLESLQHGKDVVTANKAALAFHGAELFRVAEAEGRCLYYEASVAAAIPIIELLQNGLVANQVTRLRAILNGTCNYILTRMQGVGMEYEDALREAQEKGFAEADPTLDVSGADAAHKLALLARIMTSGHVPVEKVYTEGIERVTAADIRFAAQLGYSIKLLGVARNTEGGAWDLRVHPALVPQGSLISQVQDETNAVELRGDAVGPMMVIGSGAGSFPTASSVVADIVRIAKGDRPAVRPAEKSSADGQSPELVPIDVVPLRNYLRMEMLDLPGVLGRVTSYLGMRGISIQSLQQPEAKHGKPVPVVLVTHQVPDSTLSRVLSDLHEKTELLHGPTTRLRIEDSTT